MEYTPRELYCVKVDIYLEHKNIKAFVWVEGHSFNPISLYLLYLFLLFQGCMIFYCLENTCNFLCGSKCKSDTEPSTTSYRVQERQASTHPIRVGLSGHYCIEKCIEKCGVEPKLTKQCRQFSRVKVKQYPVQVVHIFGTRLPHQFFERSKGNFGGDGRR